MLIKCGLKENDTPKERLLLKEIKTTDDLSQLYSVLLSIINEGQTASVEVWMDCPDREVSNFLEMVREDQPVNFT
jgi:hypothetical protein